MKNLKILTYFIGLGNPINFNNFEIQNNINTLIDLRSNSVGFRGDTIENKRLITWSGENVRLKFETLTQQGSGQFCIWNDWYFLNSNDLLNDKNNLSYNEYVSWKSLNFWGDDSKNQNSHNIKNELILNNININNQGFYNLQYNYKTGGTLGVQNRIFSALPFHLIVVPKNIKLELVTNNFNLNYGEQVSIKANIICNDIDFQNYIDSNIVKVQYNWNVYNGDKWVELDNNSSTLNNLNLIPGNYKFLVNVILEITNENNCLEPKTLELNSNELSICINQNLKLSDPIWTINNKKLNINYNIYYHDEIVFDKNIINYGWYKYLSDDKYVKINSNLNLYIDLKESNKYFFQASTINNLEHLSSNIINVKPLIQQSERKILLDDFSYKTNYYYILYNDAGEIIKKENVKDHQPFQYNFDNNGEYILLIIDNNGNHTWQMINILDDVADNNEGDNDVIIPIEKTPFYKQSWFYIIIGLSGVLLIIFVIWLVVYKIKKRN